MLATERMQATAVTQEAAVTPATSNNWNESNVRDASTVEGGQQKQERLQKY
jgi:hypothetical protein